MDRGQSNSSSEVENPSRIDHFPEEMRTIANMKQLALRTGLFPLKSAEANSVIASLALIAAENGA